MNLFYSAWLLSVAIIVGGVLVACTSAEEKDELRYHVVCTNWTGDVFWYTAPYGSTRVWRFGTEEGELVLSGDCVVTRL